MNEEMIDLSHRVISCKNWRWTSGMLAWRTNQQNEVVQVRFVDGLDIYAELADPRVIERMPSKTLLAAGHTVIDGWHRVDELFPDLTDPATLGCLLYLVREAWGDPGFYAAQSSMKIKDTDIFGWDTFGYLHGRSCKGMLYRSEAEALVSALESAS